MSKSALCFFSISYSLIPVDQELPFDLYVNSSSLKEREHFVRVFPIGDLFTARDLMRIEHKYPQVYVSEDQRDNYLQSLVKVSGVPDTKKTEIIKDSAISHLSKLFEAKESFSTELLAETIEGCRDSVEQLIDVVQDYSIKDLQDLIGELSFHDFYTFDHSINVSMYCLSIYKSLNPSANRYQLLHIGLGGLLHDIGKMLVGTDILNSTGKLSDEEFHLIRQHPEAGEKLLNEKEFDIEDIDFSIIKRIITEHHENFDGSGYPKGLKGGEVHHFSRICAVADFFDAITTKRSYAPVLSMDDAVALMSKSVGKKLDPEIFGVFVKNVKKLVGTGQHGVEMDPSFDPSIPYMKFPIKKVEARKLKHNLFSSSNDAVDKSFDKLKKKKSS